ncbi:hypothetical protein WJX79_010098 [Trebouxia sp. C0005]
MQLPICTNCPKALPRLSLSRLRAVTLRKATLVRRQNTLICRAEDRGSAVTDIRKIDTEKGGLTHTLRETVFTPESLVPVALGVGGAFLAGYGQDGAVLGAAAGAALRAGQLLFLQQTVPFTYRKHTLLLPVGIELTMGDATFKQQIGGYAQAGKLLKENNPDYQLIAGIAKKVIGAVGKEFGGGFQSHVKKFKWEVVVVDDKVPNAFVLPGGKIVVFTGLIKLMERKEDLLAAVVGHEVAHAVARHSSEKLSLGIFLTVASQLAFQVFQVYVRNKQGPAQGRGPGGGAQGIPVAWGQPQRGGYGMSNARGGYGGRGGGRGGGGGGPGGLLLNPQVIGIFTNLFLQLPFSRRAEAEADLIGLKLMGLAGYNPQLAPETFRRLAMGEAAMRKAMGGNLGALQCTHPRSETRVQMLEEELSMMKEQPDIALQKVMHKVPYWML